MKTTDYILFNTLSYTYTLMGLGWMDDLYFQGLDKTCLLEKVMYITVKIVIVMY